MINTWLEQQWLDEYMEGREKQLKDLAAVSSTPEIEVDEYMQKLKKDMDQAGLCDEDQIALTRGASIVRALGLNMDDLLEAARALGSVQMGVAAAEAAAAGMPDDDQEVCDHDEAAEGIEEADQDDEG